MGLRKPRHPGHRRIRTIRTDRSTFTKHNHLEPSCGGWPPRGLGIGECHTHAHSQRLLLNQPHAPAAVTRACFDKFILFTDVICVNCISLGSVTPFTQYCVCVFFLIRQQPCLVFLLIYVYLHVLLRKRSGRWLLSLLDT